MAEPGIPIRWILFQAEVLGKLAVKLGENTPMGKAALERGQHYCDLVESYTEAKTEGRVS